MDVADPSICRRCSGSLPPLDLTMPNDTLLCNGASAIIDLDIAGGQPPYQFNGTISMMRSFRTSWILKSAPNLRLWWSTTATTVLSNRHR